jgi:DNA-binding MarR family transcriptional regulator
MASGDYNSFGEIMLTEMQREDHLSDLVVLNRVAADPDITQALLAEELKLSIGTINGRLKRLVEMGYVEVRQARRRKLRYIITPEGSAYQRTLTSAYVHQSFHLFRQVRKQVKTMLESLNDSGFKAIRLMGEGDIAEVCQLTCLENEVMLTEDDHAPALVVDGLDIKIELPSNQSPTLD